MIYLADYIEPGRNFPGVEEVREIAEKDLDKALIQAIQNSIVFLMKKKQAIYPDTFYTYNDLIKWRIDSMNERELLVIAVKAADDKRAEDIVALNMKGISLIADYFIICHGNSDKQVQAIAREMKEKAEEDGII